MRYLEEQQFKSLSVSAEKWVDIEQVMPVKLEQYLEDSKKEGYTIVGLEQTANSKTIHEYQFKPKTLLLLGNEKTGKWIKYDGPLVQPWMLHSWFYECVRKQRLAILQKNL